MVKNEWFQPFHNFSDVFLQTGFQNVIASRMIVFFHLKNIVFNTHPFNVFIKSIQFSQRSLPKLRKILKHFIADRLKKVLNFALVLVNVLNLLSLRLLNAVIPN